jgi:transposase-like protein
MLHRTDLLEQLNKTVKRRADVVGIFPNEDSIVRLIGAVLLEVNCPASAPMGRIGVIEERRISGSS